MTSKAVHPPRVKYAKPAPKTVAERLHREEDLARTQLAMLRQHLMNTEHFLNGSAEFGMGVGQSVMHASADFVVMLGRIDMLRFVRSDQESEKP